METQWVLFDVPEVCHYALLVPLIEGRFRSALHPGENGHVMLCAESGSSLVKGHSFEALAYIHVSDNPYTLFKEAFTAIRVHLNSFRLLEEKTLPPLVDRFGWCTWDAFYLTVEPAGIWRGVKEFLEAGIPPRFLIIDDGWQSINMDGENPKECARNLVLGGEQMTARLYSFEEGERFMNYKAGSLLKNDAAHFDPMKPKLLINKAIEIERALKEEGSGVSQAKIEGLKRELKDLFGEQGGNEMDSASGEGGLSAFTKDMRTRFKGLDDIYVWHALCGAWGGVRTGSTHLDAKNHLHKAFPGLDGTMDDLAVIKIVEGGIGLVHPDQACDFYNSMHSYLSKAGVTGAKIDVIQALEYVGEEYGGRVELERGPITRA
ncbi:hypothetical protein HPP92_010881 [Vanilla planifolia]|uniref:Galactinol--sucrose galactosyltransferase n=1 Tax=Vanilla planifolia TaxID=51239 RepID=A0A835V073_VANPL|nr:hypothetical protein HPP92_010881 [Vanilla planifolia]